MCRLICYAIGFAVRAGGTIVHCDGKTWTVMTGGNR